MPPELPRPQSGAVTLALSEVMQRAIAAYRRSELHEAERLCRAVLGEDAGHFDALHLLGIIAARTRRMDEAADLLSRAVSANPNNADAYSNRGYVLSGLKRHAEALESCDRALALEPGHAVAWNNRGNALRDLRCEAEALASYDHALAIKPDYADAHSNRGNALRALQRHAEALESYGYALALKPDYADAYYNHANMLMDMKRHEEAIASYDRAIALKPDHPVAFNNRGNALRDLRRHAEALESYERALTLRPEYADAYCNRGNALRELHRLGEALSNYERALALDPDHAPARWNRAVCHLLLGDFRRGWAGYESRWEVPDLELTRRDFAAPLWLGAQPLEGKTILLHSEQGLGDTLQFCRYADMIAARGAKVVLEVQPPLLPLLLMLAGPTQVLSKGSPLPATDYHCPLLSLPLACKTDVPDIPADIPYLRSDPARVAVWRDALRNGAKPRIGLVWSGGTVHRNDHNRSIALSEMVPLLGEWAEWTSLQKEVRDADAPVLAAHPAIHHVGGQLQDFADTAALVELMDVVVTVDTSVAHLAGAMGKPVWILLPFNSDWRWLLDRDDSVWYPTARLFRQPVRGDWASVIRRVHAELERQFGTE
jgi:tetratricopeptide (TPR) repeat protein